MHSSSLHTSSGVMPELSLSVMSTSFSSSIPSIYLLPYRAAMCRGLPRVVTRFRLIVGSASSRSMK